MEYLGGGSALDLVRQNPEFAVFLNVMLMVSGSVMYWFSSWNQVLSMKHRSLPL